MVWSRMLLSVVVLLMAAAGGARGEVTPEGDEFQANAHTVGTLKFVMARTPVRSEDFSFGHALTTKFGENSFYGHMAYWLNGNLPSVTGTPVPPEYYTANLNFREVLQECVAQFEPPYSPAVEEAYAWAYGQSCCCCCPE